jgi:hypothetical protein
MLSFAFPASAPLVSLRGFGDGSSVAPGLDLSDSHFHVIHICPNLLHLRFLRAFRMQGQQ